MKKSLFLKIFGWYIVIILVLSVLIPLFAFRTIRKHYLDNQAEHLEKLAQTLQLRILPLLKAGQLDEIDAFAKSFGKEIKTRITVVDAEGLVLADSEEDPKKMENHRYRPEIYQVFQGQTGKAVRWSNTVRQDMLYVGRPLEAEGKIVGVLRVSLFLKDIQHMLAEIKINIARAAAFLLLFVAAAAFFIARNLTRPVADLMAASRKVASGDFSTRVYSKNKDELGDLAERFNWMTSEIRGLFENLTSQKQELESILSSIQEGLFVSDKDGKIVLANQSLKRILQNDSVEGKFYWEVVRSSRFIELIKTGMVEKSNLQGDFNLNEKDFLCSATFLSSPERVVVTVHDLTEVRRLEKIKKDFVLNISHELRTPLTAIQGFVETLEGEVEEKNRDYLAIIKRNTERLVSIVEDLLLLAELEEKGIQRTDLSDLRPIARDVVKIFKQKAREKSLDLEIVSNPDLPSIYADPLGLEQIFINLIDNAIKYTDKGGVRISLRKEPDAVVIDVEDTGMGIPPQHLSRIFERFYVVDRSRSKKLGGTGLGLAIVKHIVLAHHGQISVKSEPGKGTTFSVTLPLAKPELVRGA